jgi:uncharacterized OB-fold protein
MSIVPNYLTEGIFRPDVLAEEGGNPRLVGSKCSKCGDVRFPRALACPHCHADESKLELVLLATEGEIITVCRIERSGPLFKVPYFVGFVQLPEGVRVLCQIEAEGQECGPLIGRRCSLIVDVLYESKGKAMSGYKFRVNQ